MFIPLARACINTLEETELAYILLTALHAFTEQKLNYHLWKEIVDYTTMQIASD